MLQTFSLIKAERLLILLTLIVYRLMTKGTRKQKDKLVTLKADQIDRWRKIVDFFIFLTKQEKVQFSELQSGH